MYDLDGGIDDNAIELRRLGRADAKCGDERLGDQQFERLGADALAPACHGGAIERQSALEVGLAAKELDVGAVEEAGADGVVGEAVHVLDQVQADHEAGRKAEWNPPEAPSLPTNTTLLPLRTKCPELNVKEKIWLSMHDNLLSNRTLDDYHDIVARCHKSSRITNGDVNYEKTNTPKPTIQLHIAALRTNQITMHIPSGRRSRSLSDQSRSKLQSASAISPSFLGRSAASRNSTKTTESTTNAS